MVVKTSNSGFEQPDDPFRRCKDARRLTQFSRAEILIKQSHRRAAQLRIGSKSNCRCHTPKQLFAAFLELKIAGIPIYSFPHIASHPYLTLWHNSI